MKNLNCMYDVIISGAGPVGLFLACELALAKCSVLILEKAESANSPLKELPFGMRGLSAPTIEALDRRGLLQELEIYKRLKNPHKTGAPTEGPRRQVGHFAGIPIYEGDINTSQWKYRLPSSTPTGLISEMRELETILTRRAESLGVEIKRGLEVNSFTQSDDQVSIQALDQSFTAKYLIGCDGARSSVRKLGGFEFIGTEPEFTGYTMKADVLNAERLKPGRNVTERGMYLQSQPGFFAIQDFDGGAFHNSRQKITLEHAQEILRRISDTDVTITNLIYATTWTDRARQATTYHKDRVLLAGDAAHIHSPLGGQGLNLGLGDAMNLGWKLAATIHNTAPQGLLESYQSERHPVGEQVLNWSRAQVSIMHPNPSSLALNAIIRDLLNTQDGATYVAERIWGIHARYELHGTHPLVGLSTPNFEFADGITTNLLMREGNALLIDFTMQNDLKNLADTYCDKVRYVCDHAKEDLGLKALFARPDGIVAWATDDMIDLQALQQTLASWI